MKTTRKRKPAEPKYSSITRMESFASNQDAKDYAFQALLRKAKVGAYLADTGNWVVMVNELEPGQ